MASQVSNLMNERQSAALAIENYLSLFQHQSYDFQYHFTENCALDWFGKLIRGAHRVHEFLRQRVSINLQQLGFERGVITTPIEKKPSHFSTREISDKAIEYVHHLNRVDLLGGGGGGGRGGNNRPLSDVESDDDSPTRSNVGRSASNATTPVRGEGEGALSSSHSNQPEYSEICYAESCGKIGYLNGADLNSRRYTRLRISYRRHLNTNEIQFILIIYEDNTTFGEFQYKPKNVRCNLMRKVGFAISDEELHFNGDDDQYIISEDNNDPQGGGGRRGGGGGRVSRPHVGNEDDVALKTGTKYTTTTPIRKTEIEATTTTTLDSVANVLSPETHIFPDDLKMVEDLRNGDNSLDYSMSQLRTPTKLRPSPYMTPVRKPRSNSRKRATSPIMAPTPKRSAARSLRL